MPKPPKQQPPQPSPAPDYVAGIRKTGYVLENRIAQSLRGNGWSVISNKYYVDDSSDAVREIDLVAYATSDAGEFRVYTTLLISCKKSEKNVWAMLARDRDPRDRNVDWWPMHLWTNDRVLAFIRGAPDFARQYHEDVQANGVREALALPEVEVFAFQELDKGSGAPQNDSPIFGSVTSLMKAQAYEMSVLAQRRKEPAVYQFNLIAVVDAPLLRMHFHGEVVEQREVTSEQYIARYIVGGAQTFARVRFVTPDAFESALEEYRALHNANWALLKERRARFFDDAVRDPAKTGLFVAEFRAGIVHAVRYGVTIALKRDVELDAASIDLEWDEAKRELRLVVPWDADVIRVVNATALIRGSVSTKLKELFRYEGPFTFVSDFPF